PHMLTIHHVDEMKELAGNKDELYESGLMQEHHEVPDAWPDDQNQLTADMMGPEQRNTVHHAHLVYLYGNSASVNSYMAIINAVEYPRTLPVFAAEDLVITTKN